MFGFICLQVNNSLQQFSHDNGLVSGQLQALNTTFTNEVRNTFSLSSDLNRMQMFYQSRLHAGLLVCEV